MKRKLQHALQAAAFCALFFTAHTAKAQGNPVTITSGFNQDIIANGVGNASASTTMGFDQQNTRALLSLDFQATSSSSLPSYGLPTNGTINSAATSGVTFQLASYADNNALFLTPSYVGNSSPSAGTLSFNTSNVTTLYILAGATGGGYQVVPFDATINFSDNTTQVNTSISVNDWYDGTGYAIQGIGRINTANNNIEGSSTNPRLYEIPIAINAGNQNKTITGITFSFPGDPTAEWASEIRLNVLAISAQAAPATIDITTQGGVPASITANGGTLQLEATVSPTSAGAVTWSIVSGSQYATVSTTGLVTAIANGVVTVRATLNSDANIYDEISININQVINVTGVTVTTQGNVPATITTDGGTLQLEATVAPSNATNSNVTWSITAGSEYATISASGLVTATANGTVTVTATTADGSFTDTIDIVITNQLISATGVSVTVLDNAPATITVNGGTLQLEAVVTPADATNGDVTWTITSGSEYASISADGLITAIANGTITVTVTTADGSFTDTIEVVITGQYVAVTAVTVTVENGAEPQITTTEGTLQLIATVTPDDATDSEVTWSVVSGDAFASVNADGLITAIANGTVVIRATAADGSVYGEITITIAIPTNGLDNAMHVFAGVYPNPTTGIVTVTANKEIGSIAVYDIFGREVLKPTTSQIDLSAMSVGIYFVNVTLGNTTQTIKVIKQ